jgi:hypothetical protein
LRSAASSAAFWRTQRLNPWYFALKALRVALVLPRSLLHWAIAARLSDGSGFAVAPAGITSSAVRTMAIDRIFIPHQRPPRIEVREL